MNRENKNTFWSILFVIQIIILILVVIRTIKKNTPKHEFYSNDGIVLIISNNENKATFIDKRGHMWDFYEIEGWSEGDELTATMDNNGTAIIQDDKVVKVQHHD